MQKGLIEAISNVAALSLSTHSPTLFVVQSSIREAFINILSLTSVNDTLLFQLYADHKVLHSLYLLFSLIHLLIHLLLELCARLYLESCRNENEI